MLFVFLFVYERYGMTGISYRVHGRVAKKQGDEKRLTLNITHIVAVDGDARLSRAIDILLLRLATKNAATSPEGVDAEKGKPPIQTPAEDVLAGDGKEACPNGE